MEKQKQKQIDLSEVPPEGINALRLLFDAVLRRKAREAAEGEQHNR